MKVVSYFQDVFAELRKVVWPTSNRVFFNVLAVLIGVAVAIVVIGAFDYVFLKLLGLIV
jgi:preprotein translocase SecE subunit